MCADLRIAFRESKNYIWAKSGYLASNILKIILFYYSQVIGYTSIIIIISSIIKSYISKSRANT